MVKFPEWADKLFVKKEREAIQDGDGWSRGIIKHTSKDVEYDALIEHLTEFPREVQFYAYGNEINEFAYISHEEMSDQESGYYIAEYTGGHYEGTSPSEADYASESTEGEERVAENETETSEEHEQTEETDVVDETMFDEPDVESETQETQEETISDQTEEIDVDSIEWSIDATDETIAEEDEEDEKDEEGEEN